MKQKEFKKTTTERLLGFMKDTEIESADLARLVGLSPSTVSGWLRAGKCPAYMDHVIEGLEAKTKQGGAGPQASVAVCVLAGDKEKMEVVLGMASVLGVQAMEVMA